MAISEAQEQFLSKVIEHGQEVAPLSSIFSVPEAFTPRSMIPYFIKYMMPFASSATD